MSAGYFSLPSVSNSELQALRRATNAIPNPFEDIQDSLNFGSLVDAMLTEPHRVNHYHFILEDNGRQITFTPTEWELAITMYKQALKDAVIKVFVGSGSGQHVFSRALTFEYDGEQHIIQGRCKFDSIKQSIRTGVDYKTTACATRKSFIESIEFLNYDQASAWYMDLAEIDRFWILGISKKTKEVFKFAMQRGDEIYERGRAKYAFWAYRWLLLLDGFNA